MGKKADMVIDVLGTQYKVFKNVMPTEDPILNDCNGYFDKTTHSIVICGRTQECNLGDFNTFEKATLRHEIIHAFLYESGHSACTTWMGQGEEHPEHMVEWLAIMFPKMAKTFKEAGAL